MVQLAADPTTALHRAVNPDHRWDLDAQLAAASVDTLRMLLWTKTKDAANGRNRPKEIPRPGITDATVKTIRGTKMTIAEMRSWLAERRHR